jgi:membrane-associated phospholipid phosphatase
MKMDISQECWQDLKAFGGIPFYTLVVFFAFFVLGEIVLFAQLVIGFILALALTVVIRMFYFRQRPVKQYYKGVIGRIDASSFPSLHTMRASVLGFLLMLAFPSVFSIVVFSAIIFGVAVARVRLERHFVSDVIAGVVFGAIVAFASILLARLFF